ncbi:MAG: hypothetical protein D6706_15275 [Chloroflexi bacterium]|nr:MAG: hypothetical protein D6706_15275 [Chloroflexota bacterium]
MKKGLAYNTAQEWQKALGAFRIAINEFPRRPEPYAGLGEACLGLKQLNRALECYQLAARLSNGEIAYLQKVADIQERMGLLTEAGKTYMAIGEFMLKRHMLDEAIDNWERAVRLEPSLLAAHKRLAMIFQRQNRAQDAVREYLAIARILQMQGLNKQALRMCQAALRLDPKNKNILTAMELIQRGAEAYEEEEEEIELDLPEPEPEPEPEEEEDSIIATVRQMAAAFEADRKVQPRQNDQVASNPVEKARHHAQNELNGEILREEDPSDMDANAELSKLERDALIGQAMDFEQRGQIDEAIKCYERAIAGGLKMPAAYFALGMLYLRAGRNEAAKKILRLAAKEPVYREACEIVLKDAG